MTETDLLSIADETEQVLTATVQPLRDIALKLDEQAAQLVAQLALVNEQRRRVNAALAKLAPTPPALNGKARTAKDDNPVANAAKMAVFRDFIVENADRFKGGDIYAARLVELAAGRTIGVGSKWYVQALAELRDQGVLRLDRKIRGGGNVYKLVGS